MELRDRRLLAKILEEAVVINGFLTGIEYESFLDNEVLKRAVALTLANIGELSRSLTDDIKRNIQTFRGMQFVVRET